MSNDKKKLAEIETAPFRLSFPHLFKPSAAKGTDNLKFKCQMWFPKSRDGIKPVRALMLQAGAEFFGTKDPKKWPRNRFKHFEFPLTDGAKLLDKNKEPVAGAEEYWILKATRKVDYGAPPVMDKTGGVQLTEEDVYAGMWCRAKLAIGGYNNGENPGIGVYLQGLQKIAEGERFGSGSKVSFDATSAADHEIEEVGGEDDGYAGWGDGADDEVQF